MSDLEEPPMKVTKVEFGPASVESTMEGPEDGHEEWLSEGVLTDDDLMGGENDRSDSQIGTSQDGSMVQSADNSMEPAEDGGNLSPSAEKHPEPRNVAKPSEKQQNINQNRIEETLNSLENSHATSDLPEDLDAFLIRKTETRVVVTKHSRDKDSGPEDSPRHSDSDDGDGHDTDELLRMLGEGDDKLNKNRVLETIKEKKMERKREAVSDGEDDDEYIFESTKVTRMRTARNVVLRTYPGRATKAIPEDSDTDMSSDEAVTVKKIFGMKNKMSTPNLKKTSNEATKKIPSKPVVHMEAKPVHTAAPLKQYSTKAVEPKRLLAKADVVKKPPQVDRKTEHEEIINEEEFLEDDNFDLDEHFAHESVTEPGAGTRHSQRLMCPERMDEDVPTDGDSLSGDGSLYDELPSSESEELQDWFTLDIRAERAGDYLPLLGSRAYQLLSEERRRVTSRLASLRASLNALNDGGKQQAEELRKASLTLAELDAMLAAS